MSVTLRRACRIALLLAAVAGVPAAFVFGAESIVVHVTPEVSSEGDGVVITVHVERDEGNRTLTIEADSPKFFSSSQIELDGENARSLFTLKLAALPADTYVVRVILTRETDVQSVQTRFVVL